jgi:hypothetical protein
MQHAQVLIALGAVNPAQKNRELIKYSIAGITAFSLEEAQSAEKGR